MLDDARIGEVDPKPYEPVSIDDRAPLADWAHHIIEVQGSFESSWNTNFLFPHVGPKLKLFVGVECRGGKTKQKEDKKKGPLSVLQLEI